MDYLYYIFGLLIFCAVALLLVGSYLSWHSSRGPAAERVARRLRSISAVAVSGAAPVSITKERPLSGNPGLQNLLQQVPGVSRIDRHLMQSGISWNVGQFFGWSLLMMLAALFSLSLLVMPWWLRLALALGAALLPWMWAGRARNKRLQRIEQQLPDALDLMGRAMRAGHAFPTALKMVGDEMSAPLATEFRIAFDEVNFGVGMGDALSNLATRVPSTDLRYFVVAVLIQRETGGNLSELLASISSIIRDRLKLLGQVQVMSAEGRLSAWILGMLPFAAGLMMSVMNPGFLNILLTDPGGQKMLGTVGVMMLIGFFVIRKVIRIRV